MWTFFFSFFSHFLSLLSKLILSSFCFGFNIEFSANIAVVYLSNICDTFAAGIQHCGWMSAFSVCIPLTIIIIFFSFCFRDIFSFPCTVHREPYSLHIMMIVYTIKRFRSLTLITYFRYTPQNSWKVPMQFFLCDEVLNVHYFIKKNLEIRNVYGVNKDDVIKWKMEQTK